MALMTKGWKYPPSLRLNRIHLITGHLNDPSGRYRMDALRILSAIEQEIETLGHIGSRPAFLAVVRGWRLTSGRVSEALRQRIVSVLQRFERRDPDLARQLRHRFPRPVIALTLLGVITLVMPATLLSVVPGSVFSELSLSVPRAAASIDLGPLVVAWPVVGMVAGRGGRKGEMTEDTFLHHVLERIREAYRAQGLRLGGVRLSTVGRDMTWATLRRHARALNVPIATFLEGPRVPIAHRAPIAIRPLTFQQIQANITILRKQQVNWFMRKIHRPSQGLVPSSSVSEPRSWYEDTFTVRHLVRWAEFLELPPAILAASRDPRHVRDLAAAWHLGRRLQHARGGRWRSAIARAAGLTSALRLQYLETTPGATPSLAELLGLADVYDWSVSRLMVDDPRPHATADPAERRWQAWAPRVTRAMKRLGWVHPDLAWRAGLSRTYVGQLLRRTELPHLFSLIRVAHALRQPTGAMAAGEEPLIDLIEAAAKRSLAAYAAGDLERTRHERAAMYEATVRLLHQAGPFHGTIVSLSAGEDLFPALVTRMVRPGWRPALLERILARVPREMSRLLGRPVAIQEDRVVPWPVDVEAITPNAMIAWMTEQGIQDFQSVLLNHAGFAVAWPGTVGLHLGEPRKAQLRLDARTWEGLRDQIVPAIPVGGYLVIIGRRDHGLIERHADELRALGFRDWREFPRLHSLSVEEMDRLATLPDQPRRLPDVDLTLGGPVHVYLRTKVPGTSASKGATDLHSWLPMSMTALSSRSALERLADGADALVSWMQDHALAAGLAVVPAVVFIVLVANRVDRAAMAQAGHELQSQRSPSERLAQQHASDARLIALALETARSGGARRVLVRRVPPLALQYLLDIGGQQVDGSTVAFSMRRAGRPRVRIEPRKPHRQLWPRGARTLITLVVAVAGLAAFGADLDGAEILSPALGGGLLASTAHAGSTSRSLMELMQQTVQLLRRADHALKQPRQWQRGRLGEAVAHLAEAERLLAMARGLSRSPETVAKLDALAQVTQRGFTAVAAWEAWDDWDESFWPAQRPEEVLSGPAPDALTGVWRTSGSANLEPEDEPERAQALIRPAPLFLLNPQPRLLQRKRARYPKSPEGAWEAIWRGFRDGRPFTLTELRKAFRARHRRSISRSQLRDDLAYWLDAGYVVRLPSRRPKRPRGYHYRIDYSEDERALQREPARYAQRLQSLHLAPKLTGRLLRAFRSDVRRRTLDSISARHDRLGGAPIPPGGSAAVAHELWMRTVSQQPGLEGIVSRLVGRELGRVAGRRDTARVASLIHLFPLRGVIDRVAHAGQRDEALLQAVAVVPGSVGLESDEPSLEVKVWRRFREGPRRLSRGLARLWLRLILLESPKYARTSIKDALEQEPRLIGQELEREIERGLAQPHWWLRNLLSPEVGQVTVLAIMLAGWWLGVDVPMAAPVAVLMTQPVGSRGAAAGRWTIERFRNPLDQVELTATVREGSGMPLLIVPGTASELVAEELLPDLLREPQRPVVILHRRDVNPKGRPDRVTPVEDVIPAGARDLAAAIEYASKRFQTADGQPGPVMVLAHSAGAEVVSEFTLDARFAAQQERVTGIEYVQPFFASELSSSIVDFMPFVLERTPWPITSFMRWSGMGRPGTLEEIQQQALRLVRSLRILQYAPPWLVHWLLVGGAGPIPVWRGAFAHYDVPEPLQRLFLDALAHREIRSLLNELEALVTYPVEREDEALDAIYSRPWVIGLAGTEGDRLVPPSVVEHIGAQLGFSTDRETERVRVQVLHPAQPRTWLSHVPWMYGGDERQAWRAHVEATYRRAEARARANHDLKPADPRFRRLRHYLGVHHGVGAALGSAGVIPLPDEIANERYLLDRDDAQLADAIRRVVEEGPSEGRMPEPEEIDHLMDWLRIHHQRALALVRQLQQEAQHPDVTADDGRPLGREHREILLRHLLHAETWLEHLFKRPMLMDVPLGEVLARAAEDATRGHANRAVQLPTDPAALPVVHANVSELERVFMNILNNAFRHGHARQVVVDVAQDAGWASVRFTDDGSGFVEGEANELLIKPAGAKRQPLFDVRPGGRLGLPTSASTVESLGGTIHAANRPPEQGTGAVITVRLPVVPTATPPASPERGSESSLIIAGLVILVLLLFNGEPTVTAWPLLAGMTGSRMTATEALRLRQDILEVLQDVRVVPDEQASLERLAELIKEERWKRATIDRVRQAAHQLQRAQLLDWVPDQQVFKFRRYRWLDLGATVQAWKDRIKDPPAVYLGTNGRMARVLPREAAFEAMAERQRWIVGEEHPGEQAFFRLRHEGREIGEEEQRWRKRHVRLIRGRFFMAPMPILSTASVIHAAWRWLRRWALVARTIAWFDAIRDSVAARMRRRLEQMKEDLQDRWWAFEERLLATARRWRDRILEEDLSAPNPFTRLRLGARNHNGHVTFHVDQTPGGQPLYIGKPTGRAVPKVGVFNVGGAIVMEGFEFSLAKWRWWLGIDPLHGYWNLLKGLLARLARQFFVAATSPVDMAHVRKSLSQPLAEMARRVVREPMKWIRQHDGHDLVVVAHSFGGLLSLNDWAAGGRRLAKGLVLHNFAGQLNPGAARWLNTRVQRLWRRIFLGHPTPLDVLLPGDRSEAAIEELTRALRDGATEGDAPVLFLSTTTTHGNARYGMLFEWFGWRYAWPDTDGVVDPMLARGLGRDNESLVPGAMSIVVKHLTHHQAFAHRLMHALTEQYVDAIAKGEDVRQLVVRVDGVARGRLGQFTPKDPLIVDEASIVTLRPEDQPASLGLSRLGSDPVVHGTMGIAIRAALGQPDAFDEQGWHDWHRMSNPQDHALRIVTGTRKAPETFFASRSTWSIWKMALLMVAVLGLGLAAAYVLWQTPGLLQHPQPSPTPRPHLNPALDAFGSLIGAGILRRLNGTWLRAVSVDERQRGVRERAIARELKRAVELVYEDLMRKGNLLPASLLASQRGRPSAVERWAEELAPLLLVSQDVHETDGWKRIRSRLDSRLTETIREPAVATRAERDQFDWWFERLHEPWKDTANWVVRGQVFPDHGDWLEVAGRLQNQVSTSVKKAIRGLRQTTDLHAEERAYVEWLDRHAEALVAQIIQRTGAEAQPGLSTEETYAEAFRQAMAARWRLAAQGETRHQWERKIESWTREATSGSLSALWDLTDDLPSLAGVDVRTVRQVEDAIVTAVSAEIQQLAGVAVRAFGVSLQLSARSSSAPTATLATEEVGSVISSRAIGSTSP